MPATKVTPSADGGEVGGETNLALGATTTITFVDCVDSRYESLGRAKVAGYWAQWQSLSRLRRKFALRRQLERLR